MPLSSIARSIAVSRVEAAPDDAAIRAGATQMFQRYPGLMSIGCTGDSEVDCAKLAEREKLVQHCRTHATG